MNFKLFIICLVILIGSSILVFGAMPQGWNEEVYVDDYVFVDTSIGYGKITPAIKSGSGWVEFEFNTSFGGNTIFSTGTNGEWEYTKVQYWNPTLEVAEYEYTCTETLTTQGKNYECKYSNDTVKESGSFNTNLGNGTLLVDYEYTQNWQDLPKNFQKKYFTWDDKNEWLESPPINLQANTLYKLRFWVDIPSKPITWNEPLPQYKYTVCWRNSAYTNMIDAETAGELNCIDPFTAETNQFNHGYKLSDGTDENNTVDYSLTGAANFVNGKIGNAVQVNISGDGCLYNSSSVWIDHATVQSGPWSISAWCKWNTDLAVASYCWEQISLDGDRTNIGVFMDSSAGGSDIAFEIWDGSGRPQDTDGVHVNFGQWYHIVVTYNGTFLNYFINGTNVGNDSTSIGAGGAFGQQSAMGCQYQGAVYSEMDGEIDALYVWERLISVEEVEALWNSGDGIENPFASNTAPNTTTPTITQTKINPTTNISATALIDDPDGDTLTGWWTLFVNGDADANISNTSVSNGTTLGITFDASLYGVGDTLIVQMTPDDGTINGTAKNSSSITVQTHTSWHARNLTIPTYTFGTDTYIDAASFEINLTEDSNVHFLDALSMRKTTGGGSATVYSRILLNGTNLVNTTLGTVNSINSYRVTGNDLTETALTTGIHNVTVQFKRDGTGNIEITDYNLIIIGNTTPAGGSFNHGQIFANYTFNSSEWTRPYTNAITLDRTQNVFTANRLRVQATGEETLDFHDLDITSGGASAFYKRYLSSASDIGTLTMNSIITASDTNYNFTTDSRNYNAENVTVNLTAIYLGLNTSDSLQVNSISASHDTTNLSTNVSFGAGSHNIMNGTITIKEGTAIYAVYTVSVGSNSGSQDITFTLNSSGCTSTKTRTIDDTVTIGNIFDFMVCNQSYAVDDTPEFTVYMDVSASETAILIDESLNLVEVTEANSTIVTITDVTSPEVSGLLPVNDTDYNVPTSMQVGANITDNTAVNTALAIIDYPNGTQENVTLTLQTNNFYNGSFTMPNLTGRYNYSIWTNDTSDNKNTTLNGYFNGLKQPPGSTSTTVWDQDNFTSGFITVDRIQNLSTIITDELNVSNITVTGTIYNASGNNVFNTTLLENTTALYNASMDVLLTGAGTWNAEICADDNVNPANCTNTSFAVTAAGSTEGAVGGGGGGVTLPELEVDLTKPDCDIRFIPGEINLFEGKRTVTLKIQNRESFAYQPELGIEDIKGFNSIIDRVNVPEGPLIPSLEEKSIEISYDGGFLGTIDAIGAGMLVARNYQCRDEAIPVTVNINTTTPLDELGSASNDLYDKSIAWLLNNPFEGIGNFIEGSFFRSFFDGIANWMILVVFSLILGGLAIVSPAIIGSASVDFILKFILWIVASIFLSRGFVWALLKLIGG